MPLYFSINVTVPFCGVIGTRCSKNAARIRHRFRDRPLSRGCSGFPALSSYCDRLIWDDVVVSSTYKSYRFPRQIISHCVWPYHRFTLSFREIELLVAARGRAVSYETIRAWCARFGPEFARRLRGCTPAWRQVAPRRSVRQDLRSPKVLVAGSRSARQRPRHIDPGQAGRQGCDQVLQETTEETRPPAAGAGHRQLPSYQVAHRKTMSTTEHRQNKYLNNRCENSRQPTRQRERAMKGFRSVGSAQRFLSSFSRISPHFRPPRRCMTATGHRTEIAARFQVWD